MTASLNMLKLQAFPARDLQIVIDTKDRLLVDSPSEPWSIVTLAFLSCVFAGLCYVVYRLWPVSRLAAIGIVLVAVIVSVFVSSDLGTSYRMDMDRQKGEMIMNSYRGSDRSEPLGTWVDALNRFQRADMEFDRGDRRLVLTTSDGQLVRPLGPDFQQHG